MEKYCKNCAAKIKDTDHFCPDCGREITTHKPKMEYCPNCGEKTIENEYFCKNCGIKLKEPEKEKASFLDRYRTPIIIIAVIAAIAVVSAGAFSMISSTPTQEVEVDTLNFNIPQEFVPDEDLTVDENDDGIKFVSKFWQNDEDYIQIDVMYSKSGDVDAGEIAREMGGEKVSMMGHDGYYNELSDAHSFSFEKNNKLITVYTSNYDLLNEIEVV